MSTRENDAVALLSICVGALVVLASKDNQPLQMLINEARDFLMDDLELKNISDAHVNKEKP